MKQTKQYPSREKAGTSCVGLVYPSEEKHGKQKVEKKNLPQCSCHPQN